MSAIIRYLPENKTYQETRPELFNIMAMARVVQKIIIITILLLSGCVVMGKPRIG